MLEKETGNPTIVPLRFGTGKIHWLCCLDEAISEDQYLGSYCRSTEAVYKKLLWGGGLKNRRSAKS